MVKNLMGQVLGQDSTGSACLFYNVWALSWEA